MCAGTGHRARARAWVRGHGAQAWARGTGADADAGRRRRGAGRGRWAVGTGCGRWAQAWARGHGRRRGAQARGAGVNAERRLGHGARARARARGASVGARRGARAWGHGRRRGCGRWAQAGIRCAKSKGNLRRIAYRRAHNGFRAQGRVKYGGTATGNHWGCRRAASSAPQQANGSRNRLPFVRCDCNMQFSVMGQPASGADAYEFYSIPRRRF